jgi:hypothetical protein
MADSTEVIVLDLRSEVLRARREKVEALRTSRHGVILKSVLGALLLLAVSAVLFALLRR